MASIVHKKYKGNDSEKQTYLKNNMMKIISDEIV